MKKITFVLIFIITGLFLFGCGNATQTNTISQSTAANAENAQSSEAIIEPNQFGKQVFETAKFE